MGVNPRINHRRNCVGSHRKGRTAVRPYSFRVMPQSLRRRGILFYSASFASLETGVWLIMVLTFYALQKYERERDKRRQALIALGIEAQRRSQDTGKPVEDIVKELQAEDWKPDDS